jgi:ABC-type transport system involved in multi-copper enzyme maturation permease subunit
MRLGGPGRMWALALNTFREAARSRVLYGILILVVGANLVAVGCSELSIHEQQRVARDFSLAGISLLGSLTAIVLGVLLLYQEVQKRTIHSIVSKPIERWEFVLGKYLGMALVLSLLVVLFVAAMTLQLASQGVAVTAALVKAVLLAWVEVLTVAAIAVFFSSFSSPFLSGIFALALFVIGSVTPDIEFAVDKAKSPWIRWVAEAALQIVPDLHLFTVSGRTIDEHVVSVNGDFVSWGYVGMACGHGALWIIGLLLLACVIFRRRDFV